MAKTLLTGVNQVLQRVQLISSSNPLTSLVDSPKQVFIDLAVQAWNEAVDQIFSKTDPKGMKPLQGSEDYITIISGQRDYDLPDDLVQLRWPFHDETKGRYINQYPGGYEELRNSQTQPDNYTGEPTLGAINKINGMLYLNNIPSSTEAGDKYKFFYWKDITLSRDSDLFPFSDTVFRAMVPVVTEVWRYYQNNKYTEGMAKVSYGRAVRALKQEPQDIAWIKRPGSATTTSPLGYDPFSN